MRTTYYILGSLALSSVDAFLALSGTVTPTDATNFAGTYTYTLTGDCFSTGTATTLGLNNTFYQYYGFTLSAGTFGIASNVASWALSGCSHSHVYSFIGQPMVTTSATSIDGLVDAVAAYGYTMTGASVTACAASSVVTATTFYNSTTKVFMGSKYQSVGTLVQPGPTATNTTIVTPVQLLLSPRGGTNLYTKAGIAATHIMANTVDGLVFNESQNAYWDFL